MHSFSKTPEPKAPLAATGPVSGVKSLPSTTSPSISVQAKLEVTEPGDSYEMEADAMADLAISRVSSPLSGSPNGTALSSSLSPASMVSRLPSGHSSVTVSPALESAISSSKGGGFALPASLKGQMESGFGADFSDVRLHTGPDASSMSSSIQAKAFTSGKDIYFNEGQFNPDTTDGQRIIAHELAHTLQQTGMVARKKKRVEKKVFSPSELDKTITEMIGDPNIGAKVVKSVIDTVSQAVEEEFNFTEVSDELEWQLEKSAALSKYKKRLVACVKAMEENSYSKDEIKKHLEYSLNRCLLNESDKVQRIYRSLRRTIVKMKGFGMTPVMLRDILIKNMSASDSSSNIPDSSFASAVYASLCKDLIVSEKGTCIFIDTGTATEFAECIDRMAADLGMSEMDIAHDIETIGYEIWNKDVEDVENMASLIAAKGSYETYQQIKRDAGMVKTFTISVKEGDEERDKLRESKKAGDAFDAMRDEAYYGGDIGAVFKSHFGKEYNPAKIKEAEISYTQYRALSYAIECNRTLLNKYQQIRNNARVGATENDGFKPRINYEYADMLEPSEHIKYLFEFAKTDDLGMIQDSKGITSPDDINNIISSAIGRAPTLDEWREFSSFTNSQIQKSQTELSTEREKHRQIFQRLSKEVYGENYLELTDYLDDYFRRIGRDEFLIKLGASIALGLVVSIATAGAGSGLASVLIVSALEAGTSIGFDILDAKYQSAEGWRELSMKQYLDIILPNVIGVGLFRAKDIYKGVKYARAANAYNHAVSTMTSKSAAVNTARDSEKNAAEALENAARDQAIKQEARESADLILHGNETLHDLSLNKFLDKLEALDNAKNSAKTAEEIQKAEQAFQKADKDSIEAAFRVIDSEADRAVAVKELDEAIDVADKARRNLNAKKMELWYAQSEENTARQNLDAAKRTLDDLEISVKEATGAAPKIYGNIASLIVEVGVPSAYSLYKAISEDESNPLTNQEASAVISFFMNDTSDPLISRLGSIAYQTADQLQSNTFSLEKKEKLFKQAEDMLLYAMPKNEIDTVKVISLYAALGSIYQNIQNN